MKIILNAHPASTNFSQALHELVAGADTLSVAVSYLQVSGWHLFRRHTQHLSLPRMRLVCTDQLAITPPAAVRLAQGSGVQIRNYDGNVVYHPKVYLAHNRAGQPTRFLLGSANLSHSAFTNSVEAGVISSNADGLSTLNTWFNDLFSCRSADFTAVSLAAMETRWLAAASSRAQARLLARRAAIPAPAQGIQVTVEDIDTLDDIFSTISLPLGLLNMDYAGNNIRNVSRVREVLANWPTVRASHEGRHSKQRSELKLLGFAQPPALTALGRAAAAATSDEAVARLWCAWLQATPNATLALVNAKLLVAKRVFARFWRLQPGVRNYFLSHAENPGDQEKRTLQNIELLCNASAVAESLSLVDIQALAPLLDHPARLPAFVGAAISEYRDHKGARSWGPDRRVITQAWLAAAT